MEKCEIHNSHFYKSLTHSIKQVTQDEKERFADQLKTASFGIKSVKDEPYFKVMRF